MNVELCKKLLSIAISSISRTLTQCKNILKCQISVKKKILSAVLHLQADLHSCSHKNVLTTQILWTLTYSDNVGEKLRSAPFMNVSTLNYFLFIEPERQWLSVKWKVSCLRPNQFPIIPNISRVICFEAPRLYVNLYLKW